MCPVDVDKMPEGSLPDLQAFERAAEILRNLSSAKATGAEKTHLHERFEDGKSSLTNGDYTIVSICLCSRQFDYGYPLE